MAVSKVSMRWMEIALVLGWWTRVGPMWIELDPGRAFGMVGHWCRPSEKVCLPVRYVHLRYGRCLHRCLSMKWVCSTFRWRVLMASWSWRENLIRFQLQSYQIKLESELGYGNLVEIGWSWKSGQSEQVFLNWKYPSASFRASEYSKLKNLHCKGECWTTYTIRKGNELRLQYQLCHWLQMHLQHLVHAIGASATWILRGKDIVAIVQTS